MSGYERIILALDAIGKTDEYLEKFKENEMDDAAVIDAISDPELTASLNEIITIVGRRVKFMKEFKKLGGAEEVKVMNISPDEGKKQEETLRGSLNPLSNVGTSGMSQLKPVAAGANSLNEEQLATSFFRSASIRSKEQERENNGSGDTTSSSALSASLQKFNLIMDEYTSLENDLPYGENETFQRDDELENLFQFAEKEAYKMLRHFLGLDDACFSTSIELVQFRTSIENAKTLFKIKNNLNKGKYTQNSQDEVRNAVQKYKCQMKVKTLNKFISAQELQGLHFALSQELVQDLHARKCKAKLYEATKEQIKKELETELSELKKMVQSTNDKMMHQVKRLLDEALTNYKKKMSDYQGLDEEFLRKVHDESKTPQLRWIQYSDQIPSNNQELRNKIHQDLCNEIENCFPRFLNGLHVRLQKFQAALQKGVKNAESFYNQSMDDYFGNRGSYAGAAAGATSITSSIPKFYEESALLTRHESTLNQSLKKFNDEIEDQLKNPTDGEKLKNEALNELNSHIEHKFKSCKELNHMREAHFEDRARNFLREAENFYSSRIRTLIEESFDESELTKKEEIIQKETFRFLHSKFDPSIGKASFIKELDEDLQDHMKNFFQDHLELFQMRLDEDEIAVRTALFNAKTYYNEQMEKHFVSKDFIQPAELDKLNNRIMADSIRNCREEIDLSKDQERKLKDAMKVVYQKFVDKNILRLPTENTAIGIDLGTTFSCVAVCINENVKIIPNENGSTTTPSYVAFSADGSVVVGEAAKEQSYANPQNTVYDAKRLIGRKWSDPSVQKDMKIWPFEVVENVALGEDDEVDRPEIRVHGRTYKPEEISAFVLIKMKEIAENYLGKTVKDCVITVPALFNDSQRQATKDAGAIAGLNVLKIINEPTAASIAHNLHRTDDLSRNVLIFDLGGGTFDVAVLKMSGGEIQVKAVHGDTHLGGEDFDGQMVACCIEDFKKKHQIDLGRGRNASSAVERYGASGRIRRMKLECEKQKRILSAATSTAVKVEMIDQGRTLDVPFTRSLFESLNAPQFQECIKIVEKALNEARMSKTDIDDIVLVGGSTRIPKVQEMLEEFFDGKALSKQINPDEAVAYGAAVHAALLSAENYVTGRFGKFGGGLKLQDVTPLSVGVELDDRTLNVLIPKNSTVPCSFTKSYFKVYEQQTECLVSIYEGEKLSMASDNNLLGEFTLLQIPRGQPYSEPIDVTMTISDEGILNVKAVVRSNQKSNELAIITRKKRMTTEELERAKAATAAVR